MSALLAALAAGTATALLVPAASEVRLVEGRRRRWGVRPAREPAAAVPDLDAVAALLDRLAALLRAGLGPRTVWEHLAQAPGPCRPVCAYVAESLAAGGEPGAAVAGAAGLLDASGRRAVWSRRATPGGAVRSRRAMGGRAVRGRPGGWRSGRWWSGRWRSGRAARRPAHGGVAPADVVRWLAAATAVSARTGAPAADCVDRLAASVRAETAAADERAGALAGPRATAQVLAWLPAAGIVLGALVGANPVRTLLLAGPGRVCLLAGGLLWLAGRTWTRALVRSAERAGG